MRAEHRKDLQTNLLANQLGRLIKQRSYQSFNTVWVIVGIAAVVAIAYWWWSARTSAALTAAWVDFYNSKETPEAAQQAAERHEGTSAERAARLAQADHLFDEAYQEFFRGPQDARQKFMDAAEAYKEVGGLAAGMPDISARALLGQAKCNEWLGEINRARHFYNELLTRYKDSALAAAAEASLKKLEDGGEAAFYKDWPNRLPAITQNTPPPKPPEPPPEAPPPSTPAEAPLEPEKK